MPLFPNRGKAVFMKKRKKLHKGVDKMLQNVIH